MHEKKMIRLISWALLKLKTSVLQETKSISFLVMGGARCNVSFTFFFLLL